MIGFHTNLDTINSLPNSCDNQKFCYQLFLGSPLNDKIPEFKQITNNFYVHSKYIINFIDKPKYKLKSINEEIKWLLKSNMHTGTVVHLMSSKTKSRIESLNVISNTINHYSNQELIIIETPDNTKFLGSRLDDLEYLARRTKCKFCIDTAHLYVTGHDISNYTNCIEYFINFFFKIGIDRLKLIHLNDTKGKLFSNYKPHAEIGSIFEYGKLGSIDIIKVLNTYFKIDIIFERGTLKEFTPEITKFVKYELLTERLDKILNDFSNFLIIQYLKYFSENVYNQYKEAAYNEVLKYFENNYTIFYKNGIYKEPKLNFTQKMKDTISYIAKNFKTNKILYPKIPYLSQSDFEILKKHNLYYIDDMMYNIHLVKKYIPHNKIFLNYIKVIELIQPIDVYSIKDLVKDLTIKNKIEVVGSYNRSKIIKDLDILVSKDKLNCLFEALKRNGVIITIIKNGEKYKNLIYKYNEENIVFQIDIFIVDKIRPENIINYSLSDYENRLYRGIAKKMGYKMNFDGIINKDKKEIRYTTLKELKNILKIT